ncbi:hypothetical protein L1887_15320 [Cichorium endivia]|nr:hypothetical protein L1887_15320 [Cichorium endivia]
MNPQRWDLKSLGLENEELLELSKSFDCFNRKKQENETPPTINKLLIRHLELTHRKLPHNSIRSSLKSSTVTALLLLTHGSKSQPDFLMWTFISLFIG